jgi:hypothetical protein
VDNIKRRERVREGERGQERARKGGKWQTFISPLKMIHEKKEWNQFVCQNNTR